MLNRAGKIVVIMYILITNPLLGKPTIGKEAPDFSLVDQDGKMRRLSDFKGRYVVLYFYPQDETSNCTKQACQIRDSYDRFTKNNIVVLGVSYDSPASHKKFIAKERLPFILLSDMDHTVAKLYDANRFLDLPYPKRKTFVINPAGIICGKIKHVDVKTHVGDVMRLIEIDKNAKKNFDALVNKG
jgi:peroxiredoxin Q/BCP